MNRPGKESSRAQRIVAIFGRRGTSGRTAARARPRVEPLEGRSLLATLTVTSAADAGPGTLRQAILDANLAPGADVIRFANSLRGQTIALTSGPLTITDSLALDGPGASRLTISGGGASGLLVVAHETATPDAPRPVVRVEGLTFADGLAFRGGAILATQSDLTVEGCTFLHNGADFQGGAIAVIPGLYVDDQFNTIAVPGSLTVRESTFDANQVPGVGFGHGGALAILDTSATIDDTRFTGNSAPSGGAVARIVFDVPVATLDIDDSRFVGNTVRSFGDAQGGAIYSTGDGNLDITDSDFEANSVTAFNNAEGGAIYAAFLGVVTIDDSRFVGNSVESSSPFPSGSVGVAFGGAISGQGLTAMHVADSLFVENRVAGGFFISGGAINAANLGPDGLTIDDSRFTRNEARGLPALFPSSGFTALTLGGAVSNTSSPLTVDSSSFRDNRAVGADYQFGFGGSAAGGAIANWFASMDLRDSRFEGNEARGGQGGANPSLADSFARGGAVDVFVDSFFGDTTLSTIVDCAFTGNAAIGGDAIHPGFLGGFAGGGGLALTFGPGDGHTLRDLRFTNNRAAGGDGVSGAAGGDAAGGGLLIESATVTVSDAHFSANTAQGGDSPDGPAGNASGGAIRSTGDLTIRDAHLSGNRALGGSGTSGGNALGGGLFAAGVLFAKDLNVTANRADAGPAGEGFGGGIYIEAGTTAVIRRSRVKGNKATTAGDQIFGSYTT
jgi:hypothetical protein